MRRRMIRWTAGCLLAALLACGCAPRRGTFDVPPAPTPLTARVCPPPAATPVPSEALTMERAAVLALDRNPDLGMAEARIRQAIGYLQGALAERNPRLTGDVSFLGGDSPSMYLMKRVDARTFQPGTDLNDPGTFWNLEVGATLRHNLWDGGRRRLGIWSAEAGVGAARSRLDAVANQLVAAVFTTFLQARAAEALLETDEASVRTVQAQVDETRVLVDNGRVLKSDLLSLQVRLAEAKERRLQTDLARRSALAGLKQLLALPPSTDMVLADPGELVDDLPSNRESALVQAYRGRPEMKAARQAIKQSRIDVEKARRGSYPRVDLAARWYGDDEGLRLSSNWWVMVALTFDIWDGGRTKANVAQAKAVLDGLEEQDRKIILGVASDVEIAWLQLEEARARLEVSKQAVAAADETLRLIETQYGAGSVTVTRYLETEGAQSRARTREIRASLDLNRAVVNARRATGQLGKEAGR